jgi:S-formylglutathione hydrolase FrmB
MIFLDCKHFILALCSIVFLNSCQKTVTQKSKNTESKSKFKKLNDFQSLRVGNHLTDIQQPSNGKAIGNILILPGWNFTRDDWCRNSSLCSKALNAGFRLIMPEMGKSVYSSQFYPETLKEWRVYPNASWVNDTLIPHLQKEYGVFLKSQNNFLVGLSTGGRGVALLALERPELYTASAALSGDYDQRLMPEDNLMLGYYGAYKDFKERWEGKDNPLMQASKVPIYLGHGRQDDVVPFEQTQVFFEALQKNSPELRVEFHPADSKHDYTYWDSEIENILGFFKEFKTK